MIYTVIIIVNNWPNSNCDAEPSQQGSIPAIRDEMPSQERIKMERLPGWIYMTCPDCSWENGYEDMTAAKIGIKVHMSWCKRGKGRKAQLFG